MIVFAVGILLLVPCIWSETSVTGQDEYWLSLRTPIETLERGTWFTPWVNGEPRLRKPSLLYFLGLKGIQPEPALCLGLPFFSVQVATSLLGDLAYALGPHRWPLTPQPGMTR